MTYVDEPLCGDGLVLSADTSSALEHEQTLPKYFGWKAWLDRPLAFLLLVPALPLIGLLAVLIRITSPEAPAIFRQERLGRDGESFTLYKLRTMISNAEQETGPVWTQVDDPRVTRLGRILRKFHLDELPQLWNVLKGDMSLIGPRPERPEFASVLVRLIPGYTDRLAVRPGITGLGQVNLPPDTDLDSAERKQSLDLAYIRSAGLWLDVRILIWSVLRLLGISCQFATRLLGLEREAVPSRGNQARAENTHALTPEQLTLQARSRKDRSQHGLR